MVYRIDIGKLSRKEAEKSIRRLVGLHRADFIWPDDRIKKIKKILDKC